jgi:hypothetical protein
MYVLATKGLIALGLSGLGLSPATSRSLGSITCTCTHADRIRDPDPLY